jgi:hypothetical protein
MWLRPVILLRRMERLINGRCFVSADPFSPHFPDGPKWQRSRPARLGSIPDDALGRIQIVGTVVGPDQFR